MPGIAKKLSKTLKDIFSDPRVLPTGNYILDELLGGGILLRSIVGITGSPGVGKTQLLLTICDNAIDQGFDIIYFDTEMSIHPKRLKYFKNHEILSESIIQEEKTLEQLDEDLDKLEQLLSANQKPVLLVIDSIAAIPSAKRKDASLEKDLAIALEPKLITNLIYGKLTRLISKYNLTIIYVTHMKQAIQITPLQSYAYQLTYKGNRILGSMALQYATSQFIVLSKSKTKELKNYTLIEVIATTLKNRLAPSNLEVTLIYSPQLGYSNILSILKYLEDNNLIDVVNGRYKLPFTDKSMLLSDIVDAFNSDKEFQDKLINFALKHLKNRLDELEQIKTEKDIITSENDNNELDQQNISLL